MQAEPEAPRADSPWDGATVDRLLGPGHGAGDILEAHEWTIVDEREGFLRLDVHLPERLLNPKGQLFGGFTSAYVDLAALHATKAGASRLDPDAGHEFKSTINMRVDYYEPIVGPRFIIETNVEHRRGKTWLVVVKMFQDDVLATYAVTTLRDAGPLPG
jgi:acyl-coenzyme A thioesterase PaaI-like protein